MTSIEEDFETVRECVLGIYGKDPHAALDRIDGYIEQCADFQRAAEQERDALKLELGAEKFNHRKDNEYLVEERDALKAAYEAYELLDTEEVKGSGPKTEAALKQLFAARQALEGVTPSAP